MIRTTQPRHRAWCTTQDPARLRYVAERLRHPEILLW